ncbi:MAG: helix-turn-helix domain-containing protein, partial [Thermoguttaceae bacterium]
MTDYITKQSAKQAEGTFVGHIKNGFLDRLFLYSPSVITVWLALANRADSGCRCYPSISTIQSDTGLARASIYKGIKELVSKGEISVVPGGGKGNPSNHYQIIGSPQNELVQNMNQFKPETKVVQTVDKGGPQNELKPDSVTRHSNQTHSSCRKLRFDEADMETAQWMFSLIRNVEPSAKVPNYKDWANTIRLMRERD